MIVVGLGNPGSEYSHTRHNIGFDTMEKIAAQLGVKLHKRCFRLYKEKKLESGDTLVTPLTYMNNSGEVFPYFSSDSKDFIVIVDQMDLPVGKIRIKRGGGSAGHNGLKSIINAVGPDFLRIYVGIGHPDEGVSVIDHVLSTFSELDAEKINLAEEKAKNAVLELLERKNESLVIQKYNSSN